MRSLFKHNNKDIHIQCNRKNILYACSGAGLLLLTGTTNESSVSVFFIAGLLIGFFEGVFAGKVKMNKVAGIIAGIISIVIVFFLGRRLFITYSSADVYSILTVLHLKDSRMILWVLVLTAIVSFPSLLLIVRMSVKAIMYYVQIIRKECFVKEMTCDRKAFGRSAVLVLINLFAAVIIGTVLLIGVYSLPTDQIDKNVQKSAAVLSSEGTYPQMFQWCHSQLDNYTDSIMLLEAADDTAASPVEKAIMAYRGKILDEDPCTVLTSHYLSGTEYTEKAEYSRYWHGYQIILKPLLEIMDYGGIRILNLIVQVLLSVIIGLLLFKRGMGCYFPAYLITYFMLMPFVIGNSMQFSSCYYSFSFGSIVLLLLSDENRKKYAYLVFLNIGIFTAYFDFLTYPVATFGVPAVFYTALECRESAGRKISGLIKNGFAWCIGFGGMWGAKWLAAYLLIGYNTLLEAAYAFAGRVSSADGSGGHVTRFSCEITNYSTFFSTPVFLFLVISVLYLIRKIYRRKTIGGTDFLSVSFPYFLLALAPVVWYAFALNHSAMHFWFTNKACIVSVLALLFCLINTYKKDEFLS